MLKLNYCVFVVSKNIDYSHFKHLGHNPHTAPELGFSVGMEELFLVRALDEAILFWTVKRSCWIWP